VQSFSLLKQLLHAKSLPTVCQRVAQYMLTTWAGDTRMWVTIAIGFVFFTALAPFIFVAVGLLLAMPPRSWRGFVGAAFPRLNPPNDAQD
jgi:uncharacterized protein YjeT (DUF2065 family)